MLDVNYNSDRTRLVTASHDGTARVYNARTHKLISILSGHKGEVSKARFNPKGNKILTASSDNTSRIL